MKLLRVFFVLLLVCLLNLNVSTTAYASQTFPGGVEENLTVGTVQRYIQKGMTQDQVVMALGSPNMVTQDGNGKETWVYDKMSSSITDRNKNESAAEKSTFVKNSWHGVLTLITLGLLNEGDPELKDVSQVVTSQNTLTIVIKFDESNKIESYSYHSSKF